MSACGSQTRVHAGSCPRSGLVPQEERHQEKRTRRDERPARIDELLCSNDPPKESELVDIRRGLSDQHKRLEALEIRRMELAEAQKELQEDSSWTSGQLADYKAITQPIRRLPNVVLSELFLACIDSGEDMLNSAKIVDSLDVREMPWVLTRVCSRWRTRAISLPRLWSSIAICLDQERPLGPKVTETLLGIHLARSGEHLLNIWLESDEDVDEDDNLLQLLFPSSFRWHSARFMLPWASFQLLSPIKGLLPSFPVLHTLFIHCADSSFEDPQILDVFRYVPGLRRLRCHSMDSPAHWLPIPWPQLVSYKWEQKDACCHPQHLEVLKRATHLERCILELGSPYAYTSPGPQINLPSLHSLALIIDAPVDEIGPRPFEHLDRLTLPALDILEIKSPDCKMDSSRLLSLLHRSHCPMTSLLLHVPSFKKNKLIQILEAVPTLTHLDIKTDRSFPDAILTRLVHRPNQPACLLPALTHLRLDTLRCKPELLLDMIESRISPAPAAGRSNLEVVDALSCDWVEPDEALSLRMNNCSKEMAYINYAEPSSTASSFKS